MRQFYRYEMVEALSPPEYGSMSAEGLLATVIFFLFVLSIFMIIYNVVFTLLPSFG